MPDRSNDPSHRLWGLLAARLNDLEIAADIRARVPAGDPLRRRVQAVVEQMALADLDPASAQLQIARELSDVTRGVALAGQVYITAEAWRCSDWCASKEAMELFNRATALSHEAQQFVVDVSEHPDLPRGALASAFLGSWTTLISTYLPDTLGAPSTMLPLHAQSLRFQPGHRRLLVAAEYLERAAADANSEPPAQWVDAHGAEATEHYHDSLRTVVVEGMLADLPMRVRAAYRVAMLEEGHWQNAAVVAADVARQVAERDAAGEYQQYATHLAIELEMVLDEHGSPRLSNSPLMRNSTIRAGDPLAREDALAEAARCQRGEVAPWFCLRTAARLLPPLMQDPQDSEVSAGLHTSLDALAVTQSRPAAAARAALSRIGTEPPDTVLKAAAQAWAPAPTPASSPPEVAGGTAPSAGRKQPPTR